MGTKYLTFKELGIPKHVCVPFGDNTDYNKLVLDYNISSNGGFWQFEFYDSTLKSEMPVTLKFGNGQYDYKIEYMGNECNGKLVGNKIITDILNINLNNTAKYKLKIYYEGHNYPIEEIVSFIYNFFDWKNINIQYEINESENSLDLYINTNIGQIDYNGDAKNYWGVFDNSLNLYSLCRRTAQLSQYYRKFLQKTDWFYIELSAYPGGEIEFYNGDNTKIARSSRLRIIELLRPYLYRDKKKSYSDSVKGYYYRLHEWITGAIKIGKELNYPEEYFTDLKNATNELISSDFRQIVADREEDEENKERILSLGIYDKAAFDLGLIKIDEKETNTKTDSLVVDMEELNNSNVETTNNKVDNKEATEVESDKNSDNIMGKVKESMKNISTLIDRM